MPNSPERIINSPERFINSPELIMDSPERINSELPAPGFARYPEHRVAITPSHARIKVLAGTTVIAESTRALLVQESRHGDVYYLPPEDVSMALLEATDSTSYCPFKGHASYWSVVAHPALEDSVWSYQNPFKECVELGGYLAFYTDRLSLVVEQGAT